ncbi:Flp pilus assembly protein CpaB [Qipengyuania sp. 6B39]|uniref:Flp pilus assembly protein CpaB n=1 Tax=Qipengyuania proteolytica TaxID=2867239 RepID=UPI001C894B7E|nr:Flp pilus assembly protein CpaB [Qipengyuania proteolytica]MBX7495010.1 Flp pilus assembly protein CpaB [Qipengyuania proteolytica]
MDRRNLIIAGVAVLLGVIAVYLTNSYFSGVEEEQARIAEEQKLVQVAVATQDLGFGTPLTQDNTRLVNWPAQSVPTGAITDINRFAGTEVAIRPIAAGEPILTSRISERAVLSENIPQNMRAVTVPVDDFTGVAGFVTPGDAVDVMLTRNIPGDGASNDDKMTTVVLENTQVLAIDRRASETDTEAQELKMATLLVDPYGAQKLALSAQVGKLSLALRNVEDQQVGGTQTVTRNDLGGRGLRISDRSARSAPAPAPSRVAYRPAAAAASVPSLAPAYRGPSMLIYRGTEGERQEVARGN